MFFYKHKLRIQILCYNSKLNPIKKSLLLNIQQIYLSKKSGYYFIKMHIPAKVINHLIYVQKNIISVTKKTNSIIYHI